MTESVYDLLYELKSESYEEMQRLMSYIDTACLSCDILWCRELFEFLGLECPKALSNYGWYKPISLQDTGYFYLYAGNPDAEYWHINCPEPIVIHS